MNFEKIINYFRRLGQAIRTKSAGPRSKRGDKSFNERKATIDSKWLLSFLPYSVQELVWVIWGVKLSLFRRLRTKPC